MKYYVVFQGESASEAMANHSEEAYGSPEAAIEQMVIYKEIGIVFAVINEKQEDYGQYILTETGAQRIERGDHVSEILTGSFTATVQTKSLISLVARNMELKELLKAARLVIHGGGLKDSTKVAVLNRINKALGSE